MCTENVCVHEISLRMRKDIIAQENLKVMGVAARYIAAYSQIGKKFWWDKEIGCGPIIEQGTHFGIQRTNKTNHS
jgi:Putative oxidoreductase C terminal domain